MAEERRAQDEEGDDGDLQREAGLEEDGAEVGERGGQGGVGEVFDADGVEGLDERGEEAEGGEDAAGVERGAVRDEVEDAAEDVEVGEFEKGAGRRGVFSEGSLAIVGA